VPVKGEGQLKLGAHAVGPGDKHWRGHVGEVGLEQTAEAPDAGEHPLAVGAGGKGLDAVDEGVGFVDVDPGGFVGIGAIGHGLLLVHGLKRRKQVRFWYAAPGANGPPGRVSH
jgi:hypothetical protein